MCRVRSPARWRAGSNGRDAALRRPCCPPRSLSPLQKINRRHGGDPRDDRLLQGKRRLLVRPFVYQDNGYWVLRLLNRNWRAHPIIERLARLSRIVRDEHTARKRLRVDDEPASNNHRSIGLKENALVIRDEWRATTRTHVHSYIAHPADDGGWYFNGGLG